jgi:hypothetical protein
MKRFSIIILILFSTFSAFAQTKKKPAKKPSKTTKTVINPVVIPPKANQRPEAETPKETVSAEASSAEKRNSRPNSTKPIEEIYPYYYEFKQPQFIIGDVSIQHNEAGKGKITFQKLDWEESISDPIQLSNITLEKLNSFFSNLNFLDSAEEYQSERHYAHLGVMKIRLKKDGKEREVTLDWTNNKDAKGLLDEYRKLVDQFVWMFDMSVAIENQQLDTPKLIEAFESVVQRDGISDPEQLIPYLKRLGNDERIPLIGRNKAKKIVEKIEKMKR